MAVPKTKISKKSHSLFFQLHKNNLNKLKMHLKLNQRYWPEQNKYRDKLLYKKITLVYKNLFKLNVY